MIAFRHVGGTAIVLIYHRIADLDRDPQLLAVHPERFEEQVAVVARDYEAVSLPELFSALGARRIPKRAVAITFDDGYADNLLNAAPILSRHCVSATVFVCSGYTGGTEEFWWDELDRAVLSPGFLPPDIELDSGERVFSATLRSSTSYSEADAREWAGWTVLSRRSGERQDLYRALCGFVRGLTVSERQRVMGQLREISGTDCAVRESHRQLTALEVLELSRMPGLTVGGHTVHHPRLASIPLAEQRFEVLQDRDRLESMLGESPIVFSYPFGGLEDYTSQTAELVRSAGYVGACSNSVGVVKPWADRFAIPRIPAADIGGSEFSSLLNGWFHDPR